MKFKQILSAPRPAAFCNFWPFGPSFPFILAFWAFISFHFGLFGFHFLSFWPFGPSFSFILVFGLSFPFILAFWAFISFHFGFLSFHFLSFWPFGLSFPFVLAFWAFISFHFGLLGLPFFHFCFVWAATWGPPHKLQKTARFLMKFKQILSAPRPAAFCNFWLFRPSFPFILAFWAFISFHFSLLGFHFLLFWPFGPSFPFILAFWAFISFHFGFLGPSFPFTFGSSELPRGALSHKLPKTARFPMKFKLGLLGLHFGLLRFHFLSFWPFGASFSLF